MPSIVPVDDCQVFDSKRLLYVGIAPSRSGSRSSLRTRLRGNLRGNASGSTLRLSLGCILADVIGLHLQPTGRTRRLTWGDGEQALSAWMDDHAFVNWLEIEAPWDIEADVVSRLSLPLNLEHNKGHPFHDTLSRLRTDARLLARSFVSV